MTVVCLVGLTSFVVTVLAALGKAPLWLAVLLLSIAELLRCLPLR